MNEQRSQFEGLLLKSVVMLSLVVFGLYSIKTVLSDCTVFSTVNCQSENRKITSLEKEIKQIKQQISIAQSNSSSLKCTKIDNANTNIDEAPKIDTSLWEQGDLAVLEGCWKLDWDYEMLNVDTNELVGVTSWDVCFTSGSKIGSQTLLFEDGENCVEQPIMGEFKSINGQSKLHLDDTKDVKCKSGAVVFQRRMECELMQNGDHAMCSTSSLGRDGNWSEFRPKGVRLSRKRN